jgi:putative transposase
VYDVNIPPRLKEAGWQLHQVMLIFQPDTALGWHRELVRRKWHFKRKPGRPRITSELVEMVVRLAKENPRWGYGKTQREMNKLEYHLSISTGRNILKMHRITPVTQRSTVS